MLLSTRYVKSILLGVLGLGILISVVYFNGMEDIGRLLRFNLFWTVAAFFFMMLMRICAGVKWGMIVNSMNRRRVTSFFKYIHYHVYGMYSGIFLSYTGATFITKPLLLKVKEGVSFKSGVGIGVIERTTDFLIVVPGFFVGIFLMEKDLLAFWWLGLFYVFLMTMFCFYYNWFFKIIAKGYDKIRKVFRKRKGDEPDNEKQASEKGDEIGTIKLPIMRLFLFSILRYLSLLLLLYSITMMYDLPISLSSLIIGTPVMQMGVLFSFIPGSLGIFEAGWTVVLKVLGIPGPDIAVFVLGMRCWMTILSVMLVPIFAVVRHYVEPQLDD